jgi:hypothetical protein
MSVLDAVSVHAYHVLIQDHLLVKPSVVKQEEKLKINRSNGAIHNLDFRIRILDLRTDCPLNNWPSIFLIRNPNSKI